MSVLAAEVAAPLGDPDPERLRDVIGRSLTAVIAEVEALGGTVTSVSGQGLQAMFGAPEAHEDDPERAVRAAFRALAAVAAVDDGRPGVALRIGMETGPAVLGPIGGGAGSSTAPWARSWAGPPRCSRWPGRVRPWWVR